MSFKPFDKRIFDTLFYNYHIKCDLQETPESYVLVCDVPGAIPDSVKVTFEDGILVIEAEFPVKTGNFKIIERPSGKFQRSFNLKFVDKERISASLKNGVLTVTVPKSKDSVKFVKVED